MNCTNHNPQNKEENQGREHNIENADCLPNRTPQGCKAVLSDKEETL